MEERIMVEEKIQFNYDTNYFDRHYSSKFYNWYISAVRNRTIVQIIHKWLKNGKILEIGFGNDNLLKLFNNNFKIFGIDISEHAVNRMKEKYKTENFKVCNIDKEKIPFPWKFDAILAINVIEHLHRPEYAQENIHLSLKDNGLFIIHMPLKSNVISCLQYRILYDVPEHVYRPSFDSLNALLEQNGFELLEKYVPTFFPLKIKASLFVNSLNLFLGVYKKRP